MSLSGIFDPLVRAWFEENGGSGNGNGGGATAISVPMNYDAAAAIYPSYPLAEILGDDLVRVSEYAPTMAELEGGRIFLHEAATSATHRYLGLFLGEEVCPLVIEEEAGFITAVAEDLLLCASIPESAAAILSELLGMEFLPGLYFTRTTLANDKGAALIYGI